MDEIEDIRDKAFIIIEELWTKNGILVKRRVDKGPWAIMKLDRAGDEVTEVTEVM